MSKTKKILMTLKPYLFIAPAFVFLGTFTLFPILHTLYVGFFRWGVLSPEPVFIGWEITLRLCLRRSSGRCGETHCSTQSAQ